ncbi:Chondroitin sulfate synthase 1 [Armadillidium vulgare]|nr:Chondroitin sulfate synthase 1 [Armadillidium vulgare]
MSVDSKNPYNFYMLTTSETYIQSENLQRFIKTANSSQLVTQTLFPHFPSDIFERKSFDVICIDENTFIISRDALLLFRSVVDQCRSGSSFYWIFYNMDWQTCFRQVLGIPCSVPEKAQNLLFNDEKQNFSLLHSGYGKQFKNVAIFSPVEVQSMFYLDGYFKSLEIKKLETEILNLQREKFSLLQQSENQEDILSKSSFISDDYLEGFFARKRAEGKQCDVYIISLVNYELEVLRRKRNVGLTVSLYGPKDDERKTNARMVSWYKEQYPQAPLFYIQGDTLNSKSKALALAASDLNDDSLLFIIDVDMVFKAEIFDRIRWFTIPGKQVYFPIVFSEYSPNMSREKNVGSEYEHFQVKNSMNVIRVPEPGLVHVYHDKNCHDILESKAIKERGNSCANSASSVFASSSKIAKSLVSNKDIVNYYKRFHLRKKNRELVLKKRREKIATRNKKKKKSRPKISRICK